MTYRIRRGLGFTGLATMSLLTAALVGCGADGTSNPLGGADGGEAGVGSGIGGGAGAGGLAGDAGPGAAGGDSKVGAKFGGGSTALPGAGGGQGSGADGGAGADTGAAAPTLHDTMLSRSTFGAHFTGSGRSVRPMVAGCGPDTANQCGGQCEQQGGDPNVKVIRPPATLCFAGEGDTSPKDPAVVIEQAVERSGGKEYAHVRVTFDPSFVDNTYGDGSCCGWPVRRGHRYSDLVGSDHTQLLLTDAAGVTAMAFKVDYITANAKSACGYGSLGILGGDGSLIEGNAAHVLAATSSLDRNLNACGYCKSPACGPSGDCTVDSPATDGSYAQNPLTPAWDYRVVYEVWVDTAAFGGKGFGQSYMTYTHASPSKGQDTLQVQPTPCPPDWSKTPYCPPSVIAEGGNCFGMPTGSGGAGGTGTGTGTSGASGSSAGGTSGSGTGGSGSGSGGTSGSGSGGSGSGGTGTGTGECPISIVLEGGDCSAYTGRSGSGSGGTTGSGAGGTTGSGSGGTTGNVSGGTSGGTEPNQCPVSVVLEGGNCTGYYGTSGGFTGGTTGATGTTAGGTSGSAGTSSGETSGSVTGSTGGGALCAANQQTYITTEGASLCTPIPFANYPNFAACPAGYVLDLVSEGQYCLPLP